MYQASSLLINISRIIFLTFLPGLQVNGPWVSRRAISSTNSNQLPFSAPCPSSVYLLVRGLLTASPSPLGRYHQSNSIPSMSSGHCPHPTHSSKLYPSFLIPNSTFFQAVSPPSTPLQSQLCWSTFPELSFNIEEHRRRFVLISTIPIAVDC